jgi:hypothetical protein
MAIMKNTGNKLFKATACSLLGVLFAGGAAQAAPAPYSKTVTFTASTPHRAAPAQRPRPYFPANTKYSNVKLERAGNRVAMESIVIVHEGFERR